MAVAYAVAVLLDTPTANTAGRNTAFLVGLMLCARRTAGHQAAAVTPVACSSPGHPRRGLTETGTGSRPSRSPSGGVITGRVVGTMETMTDSAGAESRGIHRSGYGTQATDHGAVGVSVLSWAAATFGVRGTTTICTSSS